MAALFGAVTFDPVMAEAMKRVNEVQAMRRIGGGAADDLHAANIFPLDYKCGGGTLEVDC